MRAGATGVLVNDSHSAMRNLPPGALPSPTEYLSGRFKPRYMMQGLDESYDGVIFLGYHAAMATPGILSHTYNPKAISHVTINGIATGEAGLNALVAQHFGVPVAVITGDQYVGPEIAQFCPNIGVVQVKTSISRYAAQNLHPEVARERIEIGVAEALDRLDDIRPPAIELPATIDVEFLSPDMAEQATWIRGVTRLGARTVTFTGEEPLALYETFMTLVYLTRSLVEP